MALVLTSRRFLALAVLMALFIALTVAVVVGSPLNTLDHLVRTASVHHREPGWRRFLLHYVMLGQRGPTTKIATVWFIWVCLSRQTLDPLLRFGIALVMLNVFVGVVKLSVGRWGPNVTANAHDVLAGGDIFPSGHVSNCVMLFGVLTMTAMHFQRTLGVIAVWISITVGLGTISLDTHWVTDVLGGWLAGGIILLALPRCDGFTDRALELIRGWVRNRRRATGGELSAQSEASVDEPELLTQTSGPPGPP